MGGGEEDEEEEEGRGVTSLCHHSPVVFHSALTLCSVVLKAAQHCFVRAVVLGFPCAVCVYKGSDTTTTPEHSSNLNGITSCSRTQSGMLGVKKANVGEASPREVLLYVRGHRSGVTAILASKS